MAVTEEVTKVMGAACARRRGTCGRTPGAAANARRVGHRPGRRRFRRTLHPRLHRQWDPAKAEENSRKQGDGRRARRRPWTAPNRGVQIWPCTSASIWASSRSWWSTWPDRRPRRATSCRVSRNSGGSSGGRSTCRPPPSGSNRTDVRGGSTARITGARSSRAAASAPGTTALGRGGRFVHARTGSGGSSVDAASRGRHRCGHWGLPRRHMRPVVAIHSRTRAMLRASSMPRWCVP